MLFIYLRSFGLLPPAPFPGAGMMFDCGSAEWWLVGPRLLIAQKDPRESFGWSREGVGFGLPDALDVSTDACAANVFRYLCLFVSEQLIGVQYSCHLTPDICSLSPAHCHWHLLLEHVTCHRCLYTCCRK